MIWLIYLIWKITNNCTPVIYVYKNNFAHSKTLTNGCTIWTILNSWFGQALNGLYFVQKPFILFSQRIFHPLKCPSKLILKFMFQQINWFSLIISFSLSFTKKTEIKLKVVVTQACSLWILLFLHILIYS